MFEKEIKFIGDFCFNKVKSLGTVFTLDKVIATGVHPAVIQYISAELDFMIFSDRRKLLQQSYFDYTGKEILDHFQKISSEIKRNKKISLDDCKKLIFQAVSFNINFLVRPKWSLHKLIFNDQPLIAVEEMKMMLNYLYYYDYFKKVLTAYVTKRNLVQISSTEFDLILNKIDSELLNSNQEQLIENSFTSIGDFFNVGGVDKNKIPLAAAEVFFKEKNLIESLLKLKKAIPNEVKKQYDKKEIQRILSSPESKADIDSAKKQDAKSELEEIDSETNVTSDEKDIEAAEFEQIEGFEKPNVKSFLTAEEEQALLLLYNEDLKAAEEISNEDETANIKDAVEQKDADLEKAIPEISEGVTVKTQADQSVENGIDSEDELAELLKSIEADLSLPETLPEDISPEEIRSTLDAQPDIATDKDESDLTKSDFDKEIVHEMLKDFYGGSETSETPHKENEEKIIENKTPIAEDKSEYKIDIPAENIPPSSEEIVTPEIQTPEDELLNVFEGLDKIDTKKEEEKNLDLTKETKTLKEENKVDKEPVKSDETEVIDDYLKSIDDAVFSDEKEISTKPEMRKEQGTSTKPEIEVKEVIEKQKEIRDSLVDTKISPKRSAPAPQVEQPKAVPRNVRSKDLFSYLRKKEVKKIVLFIFANDEEDFINTTERIMDSHSYKEASDILKAVFTSYKVSPYSKEAITFTNAVSNYFRQA